MRTDRSLLHFTCGPPGWLSLVGILSSLAAVTFSSSVPLWLAQEHGIASSSALIGWKLAFYSLSVAVEEVVAGLLSKKNLKPLSTLSTAEELHELAKLHPLLQMEPGIFVFP